MNLEDISRLSKGFHRIDMITFVEVVKDTTGASDSYAAGCWGAFQSNPIAYCSSRNPVIQGEILLHLAWEKGGEVEIDIDVEESCQELQTN